MFRLIGCFLTVSAGQPTEYYRAQLGAFGLSGDLALRPVVALSGGQKSRVAFTLMSMQKLVVAPLYVGLDCVHICYLHQVNGVNAGDLFSFDVCLCVCVRTADRSIRKTVKAPDYFKFDMHVSSAT